MADSIRAGTVWVNTYRAVSFMAPFGGYKKSGIGRENGQEAIDEYLQTKSVWINLAEGGAESLRAPSAGRHLRICPIERVEQAGDAQ